ncbi:MAG: hypothetical protein R3270_11440 [Gammaproteobacteria bacterium]|nr:hypothetical protein [Gammaproteobacteria bacterium]
MKHTLLTIVFLFLSLPAYAAIEIGTGSGSFTIAGGEGRENRPIEVHYYRPEGLSRSAPVLMVMPGAGRNGDDYRDAWKEAADRYGVLVLSPSYAEKYYPEYWSYNLGNMPSSVTLDLSVTLDTAPDAWKYSELLETSGNGDRLDRLADESGLLYRLGLLSLAGMLKDTDVAAGEVIVNPDRTAWIYADFDRIFDVARQSLGLETSRYDLFGHSAGGQVLHRYALFHPDNQANRIVAANSGWYTLPTFHETFPYGLDGTGVTQGEVARAFASKLVVFLGERDDEDETRGSLRSTPEADRQGPGRLQRGQYFFETATATAERMDTAFNWTLEVVTGVGHDYRRMAAAAAVHLYGEQD